jgi:hypothetical protein
MDKENRTIKELEFEKTASGRSSGFLGEFWFLLRHNKKWWLTPVLILLFLLGLLIVVGGTGAAPFIYTLF